MTTPPSGTSARTLADGLGFVEGPTLLQGGGMVVVSLDHQRLYGIDGDAPTAELADFEAAPNGATQGGDGRIYLAGFSGAWPARPDCTGAPGIFAWCAGAQVDVVSTAPAAPNDVCFGPDGLLYVTDPVRGGAAGRLWRIDVENGRSDVIAVLDWFPNGIAFDADDRLWVADTVGRRMLCHTVEGAALSGPTTVFALPHGKPDGFALDESGRVIVAAPATSAELSSSVQVFEPDGRLLDVLIEEHNAHFTNVAIAADGTAYVTEARRGRVLALDGACAPGLQLHPFR